MGGFGLLEMVWDAGAVWAAFFFLTRKWGNKLRAYFALILHILGSFSFFGQRAFILHFFRQFHNAP